MLYATGALQPVLVHIPLKHCIPAFHSLGNLKMAYWANQRDGRPQRTCFIWLKLLHYTSDGRPASFTIFCENFMNLPPTNGLLGRFRNVNDVDLKDGNVLIIKHPLRDVHHIKNMTPMDLMCAAKLL
jgi:hypothetical protein